MNDVYQQALSIFLGFFAIMNPLANTAVFVSLTANMPKSKQKRIAAQALWMAFIVVLIFALLGKSIFHLFGITLPALRITGGILVFFIGYQMLQGEPSKMHAFESEDGAIAISPLAVPILAGPGTIATAINHSAQGGWLAIGLTISTFAVLSIITFACFLFGERIIHAFGSSGLNMITRLMGLILAVVGTQMVLQGTFSAIYTFS